MQKYALLPLPLAAGILVSLFELVAVPPLAQEISSPTPTEPKVLLHLAASLNGLNGPELKPWHLKAALREADDAGNTTLDGNFEEFWAAPGEFKRVFSTSSYTIVEYGTQKGIVRVGGVDENPWELRQLILAFTEPLPTNAAIESSALEISPLKAGKEQLTCVTLKDNPTAFTSPLIPNASYCFDTARPVLRTRSVITEGVNSAFGTEMMFQGRTIPRDLVFYRGGRRVLEVRVENLDGIDSPDESMFVPAAAATPEADNDQRVTISSDDAKGYLLSQVPPQYPPIARAARIQGTVVLQALIGKDGSVKQLGVQSGPPMLQQAALDAVRQWKYKPYVVKGKPREIYTLVNVVFVLTK